jgi:hypothetical protein
MFLKPLQCINDQATKINDALDFISAPAGIFNNPDIRASGIEQIDMRQYPEIHVTEGRATPEPKTISNEF